MILVRKVDGTLQPFDRKKVQRTASRLGVLEKDLDRLADDIEERLFEGISTRRILQLIHARARIYRPETAHITNLRRAIALIRPKPDFERYVQILLSECGYEVSPGRILRGRCGEHEVDAIAEKDGTVYFIEVKHHYNHHRMTGLDEPRIARAIIEDVQEGYKIGRNSFTVDAAMIICNTKISAHAHRYASCWGIGHIGWDQPTEQNLQKMIRQSGAYPITLLKGVKPRMRRRFCEAGILTIKQFLAEEPGRIANKTGISREQVAVLVSQAESIKS